MKNTNGFNYDYVFEWTKENDIVKYFRDILGMSDHQIDQQLRKFKSYPDIYDEFKYAYATLPHAEFKPTILDFAVNEPVREQGYSAFELFEHFEGKVSTLDVFNMLIALREYPCVALALADAHVRKSI